MRWLLCDYGEVLSLPPAPGTAAALAALAGRDADAFAAGYWAHRLPYDRGDVSAAEYWSAVCGAPLAPSVLAELVALDVASWTTPNTDTLAAVAALRGDGLRCAILSNAPLEIARKLDATEWLAEFSPRLFSCDLRATKPDAEAFEAALAHLDAAAEDVVFVDDREPNIAAARAAGLGALLYEGPQTFARLAAQ